MKLCSICNKNIASIYISKNVDGKQIQEGICMECAEKMGIPIMDNIANQIGMSKEELKNLNSHMKTMFENVDMEEFNEQMKEMLENVDMKELNSQMKNAFKDMNMKDLSEKMNNIMGNVDFSNFNEEMNSLMGDMDEENEMMPMEDLYEEEEFEKVSDKEKNREKNREEKKLFKGKKKFLDKYGVNLTEKAKNNEVDRIIGRNREIDRVVQILNRRAKNNPLLLGEPGVGKTAIAEGLAVRIVEKQVPAKLCNKQIYLLDLTAIVAGTQFRGQFEGRMKNIIDEAKSDGNVILVIDEVHNIMGAGEVHGGAMNAANILKPALARGEIQLIGATTLEEYRKHIEKDSALDRRFQSIIVEEPTVSETIEILKGIRDYYENYHNVRISDHIIECAVVLSERYITDRFLPDKAIDVIDEAGSRANLKNIGLVEIEAVKEEYQNAIDMREHEEAIGNFEKAAEYKSQQCRFEKKLRELKDRGENVEITEEDVAYVIEAWTKIPVHKITEEEAEKLLVLEERLHSRVIGQNEAIHALAKTIRRNRSGFKKKRKPSSFIFVGPTGVGKTELAKTVAAEIFGNEEAIIRIDMSEYMEKHTVSKLIGAPPGYVGYDQGGFLTDKVRRKPYSVILLDEIEKAHSDVFNMLLQILDDGILTDSQGKTTHFENTIIIMTSNAGSNLKSNGIGFSRDEYEKLENTTKEALKQTFRPEFLNRVDDVIVFTHLSQNELRAIIELMLNEVKEEAFDKNIKIEFKDALVEFLLEKGYDKKYGARPLRRAIQKHVEDEIAEKFLRREIKNGDAITMDYREEKVVIEK